MTVVSVPVTIDDPTNVAILTVSEDQLEGFQRDPLGEIARRSGVPLPTVIERIRALLTRRHHPPRAADAPHQQPRPRRPGRLATPRRAPPRRLR